MGASWPDLRQQRRQLQQIVHAKRGPARRHSDIGIGWRQAGPGHWERGPVSARVAVEDALLTPLGAADDDVEDLAAVGVKRVGDANRILGHLGWVTCSL